MISNLVIRNFAPANGVPAPGIGSKLACRDISRKYMVKFDNVLSPKIWAHIAFTFYSSVGEPTFYFQILQINPEKSQMISTDSIQARSADLRQPPFSIR